MTQRSDSVWVVDGAEDRLRQLHANGQSSAQIARILTSEYRREVSRNAVIGRLTRMRLNFGRPSRPERVRLTPDQRSMQNRLNASSYRPKLKVVKAPPEPKASPCVEPISEAFPATAVPLTKLGAHMCKWPLGPLLAPPEFFCGAQREDDGPYCGAHAIRSVAPPQPGKKKPSAAELIHSLKRYAA